MFGVAKSRMYRASERVERCLLECLAERWMRMNHAADVLEPAISSENTAESSETAAPCRLDVEDLIVVLVELQPIDIPRGRS
jgi:hypothetical protein